ALVLSLGVSPFLMTATECVIQLAFNTGAATYGGDSAVAIMSILFSVAQISNLPVQGFCQGAQPVVGFNFGARKLERVRKAFTIMLAVRSEEHTSELQSRFDLVCRLLLEKKNNTIHKSETRNYTIYKPMQ